MVENEFKLLLTEQQYNVIKAMFAWDRMVKQTNFYFDTAELSLNRAHITCRVRRIDEEHFLQMKLPNGAAFSRIELEKPLGRELPQSLSASELNELSGRSDMPDVKLIGELFTRRFVKDFGGAEVDLDKSSYFGKTDHELEIEFTDEAAARAVLGVICEKAGIVPSGDVCLGKVHRFLAEYRQHNGQ